MERELENVGVGESRPSVENSFADSSENVVIGFAGCARGDGIEAEE